MSRDSNSNKIFDEMWNDCFPAISVPVNYEMLAPDLEFMLGFCHGIFSWLSGTSTPQLGKAKYLP